MLKKISKRSFLLLLFPNLPWSFLLDIKNILMATSSRPKIAICVHNFPLMAGIVMEAKQCVGAVDAVCVVCLIWEYLGSTRIKLFKLKLKCRMFPLHSQYSKKYAKKSFHIIYKLKFHIKSKCRDAKTMNIFDAKLFLCWTSRGLVPTVSVGCENSYFSLWILTNSEYQWFTNKALSCIV